MAPDYALAPNPGYKVLKVALNMLTFQYTQDLGNESFIFLLISPVYLETDAVGDDADLPAEVGAQPVVDIMKRAGQAFNGKFQNIHVNGWENADGPNKDDSKNP